MAITTPKMYFLIATEYTHNIWFYRFRFKKRVLIEQLENFLEEIHNRSINMNHVDTL